jgi:hypothetical protein
VSASAPNPARSPAPTSSVLLLTDPLGVLNAETDRLLGVKTRVHLQPLAMRTPARTGAMSLAAGSLPDAAQGTKAAWGLQLRINW